MKKAWKSVLILQIQNNPPMVNGLLSAIMTQNEVLYKSKLLQQFLIDEVEPAVSKNKVGSGTILEDTPANLPTDESPFRLIDVIARPLKINSLRRSVKNSVPKYCMRKLQIHLKFNSYRNYCRWENFILIFFK